MAYVDSMLGAFTIIVLLTNAVLISFTGLPSNITGTEYYDFGLSNIQISDLNRSYAFVDTDAYNIRSTTENAFTGSTEEENSQDILNTILLGFGKNVFKTIVFTIGVYSLVAGMIKYLFYLLFGYIFWIDYFLAPLQGQGAISGMFNNLGSGLKAFFFIIQLLGFTKIILPIFTGGRTT